MSRVLKNSGNVVTQKYRAGYHDGIDLVGAGYSLDYIVAHSSGTVVGVRKDYATQDKTGNSYGNYVKIKHDNGYYTLYAHMKLNSVTVNIGDRVSQGQVIGYMGATGHATGAHLHFEVRNESDKTIDPTSYIDANLPSASGAPSTPTTSNETVYTVVAGDTVAAICRKYYSQSTKAEWDLIKNENGLDSNYTIYPGQTLIIPTTGTSNAGSSELKVGDKVKIIGNGSSQANGGGTTAGGIGWTRTIIKIQNGAKNPYCVGSGTVATGWYPDSSLQKL